MTGDELNTEANIDPNASVEPASDTSEADMGAVFDRLVTNNGADRAEDGKFASADGPKPESDAKSDEQTAADGGEAGEGEAEVVTATSAPAHLPQTTKAVWDKMPPEAQAEMARLTGEWDRKFGDLGKQLQGIKPIADKLTELTEQIPALKGMSPEQLATGAAQLAKVQNDLNQNALQTIIDIASQYKVLPQLQKALSGQGGEQGDQGQLVTELRQEISGLKQELSKVGNPDTIRDTVSTAFMERETQALVEQFAANDGKDYWAAVEADMPLYINHVMDRAKAQGQQMAPADILKTAYDMAINANPDVRVKVREAEANATAKQPDPQRAEAVRRATSVNVKSTSNGKDRSMTEDEAMAAAYDRVMAN